MSALLIGVILIFAFVNGAAHDEAQQCRGGPDKMDALGIDYRSNDGVHWTATYPCLDGGSTTVPIARNKVPGGGR